MAYLTNPTYAKAILEAHGFTFQKKYGQNFLIDANVLEKIIESADITKDDTVLEIGPGMGTMTQRLCECAGKVLAVEIDKALLPVLDDTLSTYKNVRVINADILKLDIKKLVEEENNGRPIKVVANLPYYITTPIIMELLEARLPIASITVMVQKEVAQRMEALPGSKEYGALSLAVAYYTNPEIVTMVSASCFLPRPNVDSCVITLRCKEPEVDADRDLLFKVIKASFAQRRKQLPNGLASGGLGLTKEEAQEILKDCGFEPTVRGETLGLKDFALIADRIEKGKTN